MLTLREVENKIISTRSNLESEFGLKKIGIFGSFIRNEQTDQSDIDILVEVERPTGYIKFIKFENHLSELLGIKVDLVTEKALKPFMARRIKQEIKYL